VRDVLGLAEVADFYKDRGWVGGDDQYKTVPIPEIGG
jgi:hypothetical protein